MDFPEELVEKILAAVAFPEVFQARVFSKSWLSKFSPTLPQNEDAQDRKIATCFQGMVTTSSLTWKSCYPVVLLPIHIYAFNKNHRVLQLTNTKHSLSLVPQDYPTRFLNFTVHVEGVLALICTPTNDSYLVDMMMGSTKQLSQPFSTIHGLGAARKLILHQGKIKVIYFHNHGKYCCLGSGKYCYLQIYDLSTGTWSDTYRFEMPDGLSILQDDGEYMQGVYYWALETNDGDNGLLAFDMEEMTFQTYQVESEFAPADMITAYLLVYHENRLLIVTYTTMPEFAGLSVAIFEINLVSQAWQLIIELNDPSDVPNIHFEDLGDLCMIKPIVIHNCICFCTENNRILAYNVESDKWVSDIPLGTSTRVQETHDGIRSKPGSKLGMCQVESPCSVL